MLSDILSNKGILDIAKLIKKLAITTQPTALSSLEAGTMIATNMPYNATLNALTMAVGRIFPAMMPKAVPKDQLGIAMSIAP